MVGAVLCAGCIHLLADTAFLQELVLLAVNQAAKHVGGLIDERDTQIAELLCVHCRSVFCGVVQKIVTFKILSQSDSARVILVPLRQFVLSEEVLLVEQ